MQATIWRERGDRSRATRKQALSVKEVRYRTVPERRQKIKATLEFHQLISPSLAGLTRIPREKF